MKPAFAGGVNIALKIPRVHFAKTLAFYRDILGFEPEEVPSGTPSVSGCYRFSFGPNTIWLDEVDSYSQSDIWLELQTDNIKAATEHLHAQQIPLRDELEKLPEDVNGHWISDPAGNILLLHQANKTNGNS